MPVWPMAMRLAYLSNQAGWLPLFSLLSAFGLRRFLILDFYYSLNQP
jgi:hypothetical protein